MSIKLWLSKGLAVKELIVKENAMLAQVIKDSGIVNNTFGQCGFNLECGTCAVKIKPEIEEPEIEEEMVLRGVGKNTEFRCSCQVKVAKFMDNYKIEIPD